MDKPKLLTNIDPAKARLPSAYKEAKAALAACARIDECKDMADKAQALATYYKMAGDHTLRSLADRIKARAVRRMGELLKEFSAPGKRTDQPTEGDHGRLSQREAADRAGVSEHQQLQAVRVANIPQETFEAAVDSEKPPTVTQLAEMGKMVRVEVEASPDIGARPMLDSGYLYRELREELSRRQRFREANHPAVLAGCVPAGGAADIEEQLAIDSVWRDELAEILRNKSRSRGMH